MASSYQSRASGIVSDYANMRTIPAMLTLAFVASSLYAFGGITEFTLVWIDYTISTEHTALISLGAYAAAFASSETRQFSNYSQEEQLAVALGPAVIIGYEFIPQVNDFIVGLGDPLGMQLAFAATVVSWVAATN